MRPIKFRAFIKETKEMLPVTSIVQMNDEEGLRVFPQGYDRNFLESEGDIVLMQYTGLKDKNGVEIYDGDIFVMEDFFGNEEAVSIGWYEVSGAWGISLGEMFMHELNMYDFEIIGNIHQNPELLNK